MRNERNEWTRREFYRLLVRGGAFGAIAMGAAALTLRPGASTEHPCLNEGVCRGCRALGSCGLPAGLSYKQAMRQDHAG